MNLDEDKKQTSELGKDNTNALKDKMQSSYSLMEVSEQGRDITDDILDHIIKSKAIFKSQQRGDPELSFEEKLSIASSLLEKNPCLFLSKFGRFLKKEHLEYFQKAHDQDYEVSYHLSKLQRFFNDSSRQIDVKNRRYEALKILIEKGEYFSETELMRRNPLLYEQLVGQYMSDEQKKARDNIDTQNISLSNIILEGIDRDSMRNLQKIQQDEEDCSKEEEDTSDSLDDEENTVKFEKMFTKSEKNTLLWGEECDGLVLNKDLQNKIYIETHLQISSSERNILKQEFITNMYQNFLDGKDTEFDYSTVDDNETYDNVELRTQDEEEKYFDSESPETILPQLERDENESEDELDAYMKSLKEQNPSNEHSKE